MSSSGSQHQRGYLLMSVLVLFALALVLLTTALSSSSAGRVSVGSTKVVDDEYYDEEAAMQTVFGWLNNNSQSLGSPFNGSTFTSLFTRSASPSNGANDTSIFKVPTRVKIAGTNNSVILHNSSSFGAAAFPNTSNLVTGATFNPLSSFAGLSFPNGLVRLTLVDAIPQDSTNLAQTRYSPVWRIDAMRSLTLGGHVDSTVVGKMIVTTGSGFVGRDYLEMRQPCDSYLSTTAAPSYLAAGKKANCPIGSDQQILIHQNTKIYGSATTKKDLSKSSPWGGNVCANFTNNCPVKGTICEGTGCNPPTLPTVNTFNGYCPQQMADPNVGGNNAATAWTIYPIAANSVNSGVTGVNAGAKTVTNNCWSNLTIGSNKWVVFKNPNSPTALQPFYIGNLSIANNATILFDTNNRGPIVLYVNRFVGDNFNGNQVMNSKNGTTMNRPNELTIFYLGNQALTLNGNADMNAFLNAPNASVTVSGSFEFSGGIKARQLTATGSGGLHYDEAGGGTVPIDMQFRLRATNEYYR